MIIKIVIKRYTVYTSKRTLNVDNNFHDYCLPLQAITLITFKHNLLYITLNTNA